MDVAIVDSDVIEFGTGEIVNTLVTISVTRLVVVSVTITPTTEVAVEVMFTGVVDGTLIVVIIVSVILIACSCMFVSPRYVVKGLW